jgi:hypothetical protein
MGAEILAFAGTLASALSMTGGWLTKKYPIAGPRLIGAAGAVMLLGNLAVLTLGAISSPNK